MLIVGLDEIGEQLVLALARLTAAERGDDATKLLVTLAGANAEADLERRC